MADGELSFPFEAYDSFIYNNIMALYGGMETLKYVCPNLERRNTRSSRTAAEVAQRLREHGEGLGTAFDFET